MEGDRYRNGIVGSGEGGKYLGWHLAQSGQPTVVLERRWIGGSCPNINCLPSKNEIWSAKVAHPRSSCQSVRPQPGSAATDMMAVRNRKREMVKGMVADHLAKYKAYTGHFALETHVDEIAVAMRQFLAEVYEL
jgi:pyruvate/2-oxoglutarate dehydrogenase complex dihydrolipoamide dehydrogenase (E3) component